MGLESLTDKAKSASSSWWKWVLGAVIALTIAFVAWRLKVMADSIARLKAEKDALRETIEDLEMRAKNTEDLRESAELLAQADAIRSGLSAVDEDYKAMQAELAKNAKAVQDAKTWQELEKQARGK